MGIVEVELGAAGAKVLAEKLENHLGTEPLPETVERLLKEHLGPQPIPQVARELVEKHLGEEPVPEVAERLVEKHLGKEPLPAAFERILKTHLGEEPLPIVLVRHLGREPVPKALRELLEETEAAFERRSEQLSKEVRRTLILAIAVMGVVIGVANAIGMTVAVSMLGG